MAITFAGKTPASIPLRHQLNHNGPCGQLLSSDKLQMFPGIGLKETLPGLKSFWCFLKSNPSNKRFSR